MLATNVDVPVFFCILIPSRNMVNWKGQLPPQFFQSQAHTRTVTEAQTQSTEWQDLKGQARIVTEPLESSIIIFICLTSSSPSSICLVPVFLLVALAWSAWRCGRPPRFRLTCLAPSSPLRFRSICLVWSSSSSLSLDRFGVIVVVLFACLKSPSSCSLSFWTSLSRIQLLSSQAYLLHLTQSVSD